MKKVLVLLMPIVLGQIGCAAYITKSDLEIQTFEKKWINKSVDKFLNQNGGDFRRWVSRSPYSLKNGNTRYEYYYLSHLEYERDKPSLLKDGIYYFSKKALSVHSCSAGLNTSKFFSLYVNLKRTIYRIEHRTD